MTIVEELYVDTFGAFIGKHSERVIVTKGKDESKEVLHQVPLMHLKTLTIGSTGVSISADVVKACCERGIPIFYVDGSGDHFASLHAPGLVGTVKTRRSQFAAYYDGRGAALSIRIAAAKINNQVATLKYVAKSRRETYPDLYNLLHNAAADMLSWVDRLDTLAGQDLDELRNSLMAFEANAATLYWGALRNVIPTEYGWEKRTTRGATDPVNSLLNYGYAILRNCVERGIVNAGLDSFAGFIHADRPGKHSLTFDMMEEFRSVAVDRLVIGLLNRKYNVVMDSRGQIDESIRKEYAEKVNEHLRATVRYRGERFAIGYIIQNQARILAAYLRGECDQYEPYKAEW